MPELTEDCLMKHIYLSIIKTTVRGNYGGDYGKVVAEELGDLDANMSGGGGC